MSLFVAVSELMLFASVGATPFYLSWRNGRVKTRLTIFSPDNSAEILRLQSLYGYSEHSLIGISEERNVWINKERTGAVCYNEHGSVWLVAGEPLASKTNLCSVTREFLQAARERKKIPAFLPATERFARIAVAQNLEAVKVGASPYFDLQNWNPRGNRAKNLRSGLNRARRGGISVEQVEKIDESFRREAAELGESWLKTRRAGIKFDWLFGLEPFKNAESKKFFAARDETGMLAGLLVASRIPAREGWYLEDVLRAPDAPKGTADLLVFETLKKLAGQGARIATLGTAPLSENGVDEISTGSYVLARKLLKFAEKNLNSIYNFKGLQCFKSKFVPCWWESEFVLVPKGFFVSPRVARALFRAVISTNLREFINSKLSK
jgi:lysylphosphatidylglycerol synthetase-like protein (DUF2156 family)